MRARSWRDALASLALAAASVTFVVPAEAEPASPATTVTTIDAATLRSAAADPHTAQARDHVRADFLADSANNGRLYDSSEVETAVVGDTTVAWPSGVDVSRVVRSACGWNFGLREAPSASGR